MEFYKVGGCVRDKLLGLPSKDIDWIAVLENADEFTDKQAFEHLLEVLANRNVKVFAEFEKFLTVRGMFKGSPVDFVLARKDVAYTANSRKPKTSLGSLEDDLLRRDFTINAIAEAEDGKLIDLLGGQKDLADGVIRCPVSPEKSFTDDPLRILRAIRFAIKYGFSFDEQIVHFLLTTAKDSDFASLFFAKVSNDRIQQELDKTFATNTLQSFNAIADFDLQRLFFGNGLNLRATTKKA